MNKRLFFITLLILAVVLSAGVVCASDASFTDSDNANSVNGALGVSIATENGIDSSEIVTSSVSNVDNDSSKVSLSSEDVLESENSNTLSAGTDDSLKDNAKLAASLDAKGDNTPEFMESNNNTILNAVYSNGNLIANLTDADGNPVSGVKVGFALNGVKYIVTDANGQAEYSTAGLADGTYTVKMKFYGNGAYPESNQLITNIIVGKIATKLTSANVNINYRSDEYLVATLKDAYGKAVSGVKVGFALNGVKYFVTDANGQAKYPTNGLAEGTYNVIMKFYGNDVYFASNQVVVKVTVSKMVTKLTSSDFYVLPQDDGYLVATLKDAYGKAVSGVKVGFALNGVKYFVTDANGQAKYPTNGLAEGTYNVIMKFYGNGVYSASNQATAKIVVGKIATKLTSSDFHVLPQDDGYLVATLKDANGKAVSGVKVGFALNGVKYFVTDANGQAKYPTNGLAEGTYNVIMKFYGNGVYSASNQATAKIVVGKIATKLTSADMIVIYQEDNDLVATLKDANGNPLSGVKVGLAYNGVKYLVTNDKGQIKFATDDLNLGIHSVKMTFYGTDSYLTSNSVTARIIVSVTTTKLTWKSSTSFVEGTNTFKVLLTDTNNIILPGKVVKLTINSKTYSATTDANGYATFKVYLTPGTYTASYSFAKDSLHKASSGNTKITINKRLTLDNVYGYFVFGRDMKNVNLNSLAADGTTDLFLNYFAIEKHGKAAVENWIASANNLGMRVHIWMQVFYEGSWVNPVSNGNYNTAFSNSKIAEAQGYARLKGVSGVLLDYLRYPGTAYKTNGGSAAISKFTKLVTNAIHNVNPSLIVSASLMPETTVSNYYYGQDYSAISSYVDVVMPMIYKGNYGKSTSWIKSTSKWYADNSKGAKVWTALLAYRSDGDETKIPASELTNDIKNAIGGRSNGVILFRYGMTNLINFNRL